MNILITGGVGFIGSHIQDKLIELGHNVAILDNLRSGKEENIHTKAKFYKSDIRNSEEVQNIFQEFNPKAVFHLAAQNEVPYSMDHPIEDHDINIMGMLNILNASKLVNAKIIYSNTGGAFYGDVNENQLPITEDTPIKYPTSFYGVSKSCAESYLKLFGNLYGLKWVSLRYANVYGPRQAGNREAGIVAIFTSKLLAKETPTIFGDGSNTRDYVYVGDVVDANIKTLDYETNDYFNIATGVGTSNNRVFETIEKYLQTGIKVVYAPMRAGDALHNVLSPNKAKRTLGWEPKISFDEGVKKTIEYYKK